MAHPPVPTQKQGRNPLRGQRCGQNVHLNPYGSRLPEGPTVADGVYPAHNDSRKVLFVANDGQGDALIISSTTAMSQAFWMIPILWIALTPSLPMRTGGGRLQVQRGQLREPLEQAQDGCYGLLIIDRWNQGGTDYSIDDRSVRKAMELIQAMASKYKTTLLWLHHLSCPIALRSAGPTDVIETVSATHELGQTGTVRAVTGSILARSCCGC